MTATAPGSLPVGASVVGSSRTITDAEIAILPALMGAISPLFHDEETARRTPLGRRVLYGPALLGIAVACTEPILHDHVIALVAITDVRFRAPVGAGDTITASLTVQERHSRPDKPGDLLIVSDQVRNQDGVVVLAFRRVIMVKRED
jgi:oxepin-CoA hydrolase/3-oxo-5,6-dehydrosuberyl-CoA semialdehyde dehydrogenase